MQAERLDAGRAQLGQRLRDLLGIDAEGLGAAAHAHAGRLQFEIGIHAQHHARGDAERLGLLRDAGDLAAGLGIDAHAGGDRPAQFGRALAGTGKADVAWIETGVQRGRQFAARGDVEAVGQSRHVLHHCRHRIGLDRVVQLELRRQGAAHGGHARRDQGAVIRIEGRAADPLGQARQGDAAYQQFAAGDGKLLLRCVDGFVHAEVGLSKRSRKAARNSLRSILPFGLRGKGSARSAMWAGTM